MASCRRGCAGEIRQPREKKELGGRVEARCRVADGPVRLGELEKYKEARCAGPRTLLSEVMLEKAFVEA
jgi:hypothetical protein